MESASAVDAAAPFLAELQYSHYALRVLQRHPEWRASLAGDMGTAFTREAMAAALAGSFASAHDLDRALRELRQRVVLRLIARDLSGRADRKSVV